MQDNRLSQSAKGIIASVAGVLLVVLPIVLDGSAVKWVAAIVGICAALGVVITPNAPTQQQYQAVARDVLGTSLVSAQVNSRGEFNAVTTDGTPTTVTITPNPEQGPYVDVRPTGATDLSKPDGAHAADPGSIGTTGTGPGDGALGGRFDPMPGVDPNDTAGGFRA